MQIADLPMLPVFLFAACVIGLAAALLVVGNIFNPRRPGRVKRMPYESGMDPIHDTRRRFDVRFHLLAIAFLVFDVELLFLYPWAVATRPAAVAGPTAAANGGTDDNAEAPATIQAVETSDNGRPVRTSLASIDDAVEGEHVESRDLVFVGAMVFIALLTLGFVYDWRKGIFQWR